MADLTRVADADLGTPPQAFFVLVEENEPETFESFILKIDHTFVEEDKLTEKGKIDYRKLQPILFEMPTYEYVKTGEVMGKCLGFAEQYQK